MSWKSSVKLYFHLCLYHKAIYANKWIKKKIKLLAFLLKALKTFKNNRTTHWSNIPWCSDHLHIFQDCWWFFCLVCFFVVRAQHKPEKVSYSCQSWGQTIRFLRLSRHPPAFWRSSATSSCRLAARRESCRWLHSHQSFQAHCSASTGTAMAQMATSGLGEGQLYYGETGTSGKGTNLMYFASLKRVQV